MTLGENIRNLRKQNNMSQEQLAEKLDVSRQSVSLWEKDSTQPTIENIIALSDIFGVSTDNLLKSEAPNFVNESKSELKTETKEKYSFSKKQIITGIIDLLIIVLGIYLTWFYHTATDEFTNVLDIHFNSGVMWFTVICTVLSGVLTFLWSLISVFGFIKKKPFLVLKTVLIVLIVVLYAVINIQVGFADNKRSMNAENTIPSGVSYIDLKSVADIDTSYEYTEGYSQGQTDGKIPVNYSLWQDYNNYSFTTSCVEFRDKSDNNREKNNYYNELLDFGDLKPYAFNNSECKELGINRCMMYNNKDDEIIILIIDKGDRIYSCSFTPFTEMNESIKEQIKKLE